MTPLELALREVVADVARDHWLVALALAGRDAAEPRDAELAELVGLVRASGSRDFAGLFELQPEAACRHMDWVMNASGWNPPMRPPSALIDLRDFQVAA